MPSISIKNINVDFPKEPYPCQVAFMSKNIEALISGTNALLESPTGEIPLLFCISIDCSLIFLGTGKTLCLLCSTLAWQKHYGEQTRIYSRSVIPNLLSSNENLLQNLKISSQSIIIYASRTHSQLAQVVHELRVTSYNPKVTVLGSREQLCVHEKISKLKGVALNHACNSANTQYSCSYKNNLEKYQFSYTSSRSSCALDIEDLILVGKTDRVCPYFLSKSLSENADLILLPYNYLLDTGIRSTLKLNWQNAVIIFDEAHNLEKVGCDAASCSLTSSDIAAIIIELQTVLKLIEEGNNIQFTNFEMPSLMGIAQLLKSVFDVEKRIDDLPMSPTNLSAGSDSQSLACSSSGEWLLHMLESCGLTQTKVSLSLFFSNGSFTIVFIKVTAKR
jgi:regulator of telomere elongation helicase 1